MDNAKKGTCENCHTEDVWVRRIESTGSDFGASGRGHFDVCFDCVGPVRIWYKGKLEMKTLLDWTKEEIETYLTKKRRPVSWKTLGEPKFFDEGKEEFEL